MSVFQFENKIESPGRSSFVKTGIIVCCCFSLVGDSFKIRLLTDKAENEGCFMV